MKNKKQYIVSFSGGKDSLATLIWAVAKFEANNVLAVFCDTGWEHEWTYTHIKEVCEKLKVELITLKSKKYKNFIDLAIKKTRFPSTKARFCTEELKTKPMIDYVLDNCEGFVTIIQGIRKDESKSRSKMQEHCTYFKYYFQPYGFDKKGKPKYHSYRKKDIVKWKENNIDNVWRPIFNWTAQETIDYIIQNNMKPNPLYYKGMSRVGCFPCIMCRHSETKAIIDNFPEYAERLMDAERLAKSSFFPPDYIPDRFQTGMDKKGNSFPLFSDIKKYLGRKDAQTDLFKDDGKDHSCMSYYGICE